VVDVHGRREEVKKRRSEEAKKSRRADFGLRSAECGKVKEQKRRREEEQRLGSLAALRLGVRQPEGKKSRN
jgi:uncharacterized protein YigA (DUF484 family)